ncbi:mitochondrial import protein Pam17-domain-containing protein [Syncephalis plumigaleata]|nr:mitochondrial import protein Pam17-domain-containing protein [Syncephalis plumigaleata]
MLFRCAIAGASVPFPTRRLLTIGSGSIGKSSSVYTRSLLPLCRNFSSQTTNEVDQPKQNTTNTLPSHYRFPISWTEYFEIRRKRILQERLATVPTTLLGLAGGVGFFGTRTIDVTNTFMGLDPFLLYGIGAFSCGIVGFLLGPVAASTIWRMSNRSLANTVDEMDRELYRHIVKYRSDPSLSSARNPLPDYYGEKIRSLRDYRRWLRRQLEHRRKSTFHLGEETE